VVIPMVLVLAATQPWQEWNGRPDLFEALAPPGPWTSTPDPRLGVDTISAAVGVPTSQVAAARTTVRRRGDDAWAFVTLYQVEGLSSEEVARRLATNDTTADMCGQRDQSVAGLYGVIKEECGDPPLYRFRQHWVALGPNRVVEFFYRVPGPFEAEVETFVDFMR
jgi:hypothetical protein